MRLSVFISCAACLVASVASSGDDHDDHGAYEWGGIFEVPESTYMWTAQKVDGAYVDPAMKMAVLPASQATAAALDALTEEGAHSLAEACTVVHPGDVIVPAADKCYQLHFNQDLWQSLYTIDTSGVSAVAFFAEHVPTEFESTAHYLKDSTGEDIEPLAEVPVAEEQEEGMTSGEWTGSMVGALIVNLMTLVGVVMVVPVVKRVAAARATVVEGVLSAFAAGALLACAFFLLLFEATHLVAEGWDAEVDVLWRWGAMVLVGFALPAFIDGVHAFIEEAKSPKSASAITEDTAGNASSAGEAVAAADGEPRGEDGGSTLAAQGRSRARLIGAGLIGACVHTLCDGCGIGAAFKGCGTSFGWKVAMATVLHEIPQELADYAVLTGSEVGMRPASALLVNFLSGLSVMLGVLVINLSEVSNSAVGLLLAFGGGVYLYIAAVECMAKVLRLRLPARINLGCLLAFTVGAILIGLILLDHEHCIPEDGSGHAHGH
jgi:UTP--glucose-1-phosphate uridylyltransferase